MSQHSNPLEADMYLKEMVLIKEELISDEEDAAEGSSTTSPGSPSASNKSTHVPHLPCFIQNNKDDSTIPEVKHEHSNETKLDTEVAFSIQENPNSAISDAPLPVMISGICSIDNEAEVPNLNIFNVSSNTNAYGNERQPQQNRLKLVSKLTNRQLILKFPEDLYELQGNLHCKFCPRLFSGNRVDNITDHLKSKIHLTRKASISKMQKRGSQKLNYPVTQPSPVGMHISETPSTTHLSTHHMQACSNSTLGPLPIAPKITKLTPSPSVMMIVPSSDMTVPSSKKIVSSNDITVPSSDIIVPPSGMTSASSHIIVSPSNKASDYIRDETGERTPSNYNTDEFYEILAQNCARADIPLSAGEQLHKLFDQYCREFSDDPVTPMTTISPENIQSLFDAHFPTLKATIASSLPSIIIDESYDNQHRTILNILAAVNDTAYLIDVRPLEQYTHATYSKAIIQAINLCGIEFESVQTIVTSTKAMNKKAFMEVLQPLLPNAVHIVCMRQIINLVGEVFQHSELDMMTHYIELLSVTFDDTPSIRSQLKKYLKEHLAKNEDGLPPKLGRNSFKSWAEVVEYHSKHAHLYATFLDNLEDKSQIVQKLINISNNDEMFTKIKIQLMFAAEFGTMFASTLKKIEDKSKPMAIEIFDEMQNSVATLEKHINILTCGQQAYIEAGKLQVDEAVKMEQSFQDILQNAYATLEKHYITQPAYEYYKSCRIFNPRLLPKLSHTMEANSGLNQLQNPSIKLVNEFTHYCKYATGNADQETFDCNRFWETLKPRLSLLSNIAQQIMWTPVVTVDVENSFKQYRNVIDQLDKSSLTYTKQLIKLYYWYNVVI